MSRFYSVGKNRNHYDSLSLLPFKLSRSKIDLFLNCPRCFYLDRKLGVSQPPGFPFSLNSAVDKLLKKEFDIHRAKSESHPLMKTYGIDAIPYRHDRIDDWRDHKRGIRYHDPESNFEVFGAIDDVWVNPTGEYIIVDYKATSKDEEITLDEDWKIQYKRQMEIYQWLFKQNGYKVSDVGYFVYVNGKTDREAFDGKLDFDITIIPYNGKTDWIEKEIFGMKKCLDLSYAPEANLDCDFCNYRKCAGESLMKLAKEEKIKKSTSKKDTLFS